MGDLFDSVGTSLRAFGVAIAGIWLSTSYIHGQLGSGLQAAAAVGIGVILLVFIGYAAEFVGEWQLPNAPVASVRIMEWWTIAPISIGVAASALGVVLAIEWSLPNGVTESDKALAEQLTTAMTAFLSSIFVSWTADQDESPVAGRIKDAFARHYKRAPATGAATPPTGVKYFKAESRGERLVFSPSLESISGWGHAARIARAKRLAHEIKTHASDPTP